MGWGISFKEVRAMTTMLWVWCAVFLVAVIMEAATPLQLCSIWAAAGAVVALILELCGVDMNVQVIVFFAVTIVLIALTRPLAKRMTRFKKSATNADMNIGKVGKVTKVMDEELGLFRVRVENNDWSAVTEDKKIPPVGSEISVLRIEGVKLVVEPYVSAGKAAVKAGEG